MKELIGITRKPRKGPYKELRVPCALLKPYMDKFAREYKDAEGWYEHHHEVAWMSILGFRIGKSAKTIRRIYEGKYETTLEGKRHFMDNIPFDLADKVICAATENPALVWRQEPLSEFYGPLPVRAYERGFELPEEDAA